MYNQIEENGAQSPNDPKLSDRGGGQRMCRGESAGGAQPMTAGAVRWSAWLGVADITVETRQKSKPKGEEWTSSASSEGQARRTIA